MNFKPLITEDEFRQAEADIAIAAEAEAARGKAPAPPNAKPEQTVRDASVRPEARLVTVEATRSVRILAKIGFTRRMRRTETLNRVTRTLRLGLSAGLYDARVQGGGREYQMAIKLHSMASDPATPDAEMSVILGWVQALVSVKCPTITPAKARAA